MIDYTKHDLTGGNLSYRWEGMAVGDDGQPTTHSGTADRTVQVQGTFGVGGAVVIEGSLDEVNWFPLHDTHGVALSFSSPGLRSVLENSVWARPRVSSGDVSTSITVILNVRR